MTAYCEKKTDSCVRPLKKLTRTTVWPYTDDELSIIQAIEISWVKGFV